MFTTLNPTLEKVASSALAYCKAQYGSTGLKVEHEIDSSVNWRPSFYLNVSKFEKLAIEVSDVIYPNVLKAAGQDLSHYRGLIRVAQVTPLETYMSDKEQKLVQTLREHGFGLFTVGSDGKVVRQFDCAPLIQFVPEAYTETSIKKLPPPLRTRLRTAYDTYRVNPVKGVQDAGEVVEGLVNSIARQTAATAGLTSTDLGKSLADLIDVMYPNEHYKNQRAALGAARANAKYYRNPTSHSPKSLGAAVERMQHAREGFISALKDTQLLTEAMKGLNCKTVIYQ